MCFIIVDLVASVVAYVVALLVLPLSMLQNYCALSVPWLIMLFMHLIRMNAEGHWDGIRIRQTWTYHQNSGEWTDEPYRHSLEEINKKLLDENIPGELELVTQVEAVENVSLLCRV